VKLSLPAFAGRHFLGVDENGVGPRLGPMIVTSVLVEADEEGARVVTSRPRGAIAKRIGDSKKLVAFEDSALGEAWARAIVRRTGLEAHTPEELLAALAIDDAAELRAPCPSHHTDLCWSALGEAFVSDEDAVRACEKDLDRLEKKGVHLRRARTSIVCTRRLNDGVARGLSRFDLDLHAMERLALAAKSDAGAEIYALCGKVGGFDFYPDRFAHLAGWLHTTLLEGRARSEYLVPGVGRLAFVRDADETHLIVGLASLVGKWARDHLMRRVVRFHKTHEPDAPDASGYHDPITTKFIRATELVRKKLRVESACFERLALGATSSKTTKAQPKKKKPAQTKAESAKV
jgi:ribonuclease HII